jgi:hypothetical protein
MLMEGVSVEGLLRRIGDKDCRTGACGVIVKGSTILTSPSSSWTDIIDGTAARPQSSIMRGDSADMSTVKGGVEGMDVIVGVRSLIVGAKFCGSVMGWPGVGARGPTRVAGDTGTTVLGARSDACRDPAPVR